MVVILLNLLGFTLVAFYSVSGVLSACDSEQLTGPDITSFRSSSGGYPRKEILRTMRKSPSTRRLIKRAQVAVRKRTLNRRKRGADIRDYFNEDAKSTAHRFLLNFMGFSMSNEEVRPVEESLGPPIEISHEEYEALKRKHGGSKDGQTIEISEDEYNELQAKHGENVQETIVETVKGATGEERDHTDTDDINLKSGEEWYWVPSGGDDKAEGLGAHTLHEHGLDLEPKSPVDQELSDSGNSEIAAQDHIINEEPSWTDPYYLEKKSGHKEISQHKHHPVSHHKHKIKRPHQHHSAKKNIPGVQYIDRVSEPPKHRRGSKGTKAEHKCVGTPSVFQFKDKVIYKATECWVLKPFCRKRFSYVQCVHTVCSSSQSKGKCLPGSMKTIDVWFFCRGLSTKLQQYSLKLPQGCNCQSC